MLVLVIGSSSFVGKYIVSTLAKRNISYLCTKVRTYDYNMLNEIVCKFNPTHIICADEYSTPNNVDWYENHQENLTFINTAGVLTCAHICWEKKIHFTVVMSGNIYESGPFRDNDMPNFVGNAYARNRILTEQLLRSYKNICILRICLPISKELHPKSLINKLLSYKMVTSERNSVTILDDMIPFIYYVVKHGIVGTVNLVNDSVVSNAYIMSLFRHIVSPTHVFRKCKTGDLHLPTRRNNCEIIVSDVVKKFIDVPVATTSIYQIMKNFRRTVDIYC